MSERAQSNSLWNQAPKPAALHDSRDYHYPFAFMQSAAAAAAVPLREETFAPVPLMPDTVYHGSISLEQVIIRLQKLQIQF